MPSSTAPPIRCISSMATRLLLTELAAAFHLTAGADGCSVAVESVGGVDAAKRVQAGERFDVVVLAEDAIRRLVDGGHLAADSKVDIARSPVALAVRAGGRRPDIGSDDALRTAVLAAASIGYSTGPSGAHLGQLFERWDVAQQVAGRMVQAPPGVPVASMVADGRVEFGFQQLSELVNADGIDVVGTLPAGAAFITTFSAARPPGAAAPAAAGWLGFLASPATAAQKRRHGMEPA